MIRRPATDEDRAAVLALGVAEEAAWFGEPEVAPEEVGEWIDEEGGLARGSVAVDEAGRVRGFASPGNFGAVYLADPNATDAVADELLPWLLSRPRAGELLTFAGDARRLAAFERHGLRHGRSSFTLARPEDAGPLPSPDLPHGIDVAPYRLGDDDEAVHRLIYVDAAYASIAGHAARDLEAWQSAMASCDSLFLARRDDRPAGWVAGRLQENGRGLVRMLAVAERERGRGLGRALLLSAFSDLRRAGARSVALGVEAANRNALGLYRSVGMEIEREWRTYHRARSVRPGDRETC